MSANNLFLKSSFIHAPLANGIGRYILQCQRMTIKFCKEHGGSGGVRGFIEAELVDFARKNPSMVVYLKPRRHRSPVVVAEYLNGGREWMSLHQMTKDEVSMWIEILRTSVGTGAMRYHKYQKTDSPSIQGPWNPFTYVKPEINTLSFPNEQFKDPPNLTPTATDIILEMYGKKVEEEATNCKSKSDN